MKLINKLKSEYKKASKLSDEHKKVMDEIQHGCNEWIGLNIQYQFQLGRMTAFREAATEAMLTDD